MSKSYCLAKEHPTPTFGPIFCIRSKFTWMSTHPGVSFMWLIKAHLWSVEKHSVKRYAYLRVRKLNFTFSGGVALCRSWLIGVLASYTMLMVVFCCSECCIPSEIELPSPVAPLYVIICTITILLWICRQSWKASMGALLWINVETHKRAPTPPFGGLERYPGHGRSFMRLRYSFSHQWTTSLDSWVFCKVILWSFPEHSTC